MYIASKHKQGKATLSKENICVPVAGHKSTAVANDVIRCRNMHVYLAVGNV